MTNMALTPVRISSCMSVHPESVDCLLLTSQQVDRLCYTRCTFEVSYMHQYCGKAYYTAHTGALGMLVH